ncbi:MAG TPA: phosphoribosylaminoimidazolesuccinocarboxamide synthase [Candidatus Norongarragalinales archaeon]|nr:phosphoribosylaminoimidazolesuccinocarboxamide synthase [Candidatus Norongarragalinales archaeon]
MNFLHQGKVKNVYAVDEQTLEFQFSDRVSVFDKVIPSDIPFKGETLCRTSAFWFDACKKKGIPSHFLEMTGPKTMRVRRVQVIRDYSKITTDTTNYLIPLEVIVRYFVYGSLYDRIVEGKILPEELGFKPDHKVQKAERLPEPFFEVTTKLEKTDRPLTKKEAMKISALSEEEWDALKNAALSIDALIDRHVESRGLIHVDGKKEFAFDENRNIMVVDTFGTPDEDRFWDRAQFEQGKYFEKSKEFVRQHYRESGYHDALYSARKSGLAEPDIPPLPEEKIKTTSRIYIELFEQMTGQKFR